MKSLIIIEVDHKRPIPALANLIAGRAYTIQGVSNAQPMQLLSADQMRESGFTQDELRLGSIEVIRS